MFFCFQVLSTNCSILFWFDCSWSELFRKVQKSLAELEKLHSVGMGENFSIPASVGHNHQNKVKCHTIQNELCEHINLGFYLHHFAMQVLKSQLFVDKYSENIQHTFLDYLSGGYELNFMVAIDFTGMLFLISD